MREICREKSHDRIKKSFGRETPPGGKGRFLAEFTE